MPSPLCQSSFSSWRGRSSNLQQFYYPLRSPVQRRGDSDPLIFFVGTDRLDSLFLSTGCFIDSSTFLMTSSLRGCVCVMSCIQSFSSPAHLAIGVSHCTLCCGTQLCASLSGHCKGPTSYLKRTDFSTMQSFSTPRWNEEPASLGHLHHTRPTSLLSKFCLQFSPSAAADPSSSNKRS